ncbi:hypothetical protein F442_12048 [Phytophthora nicotianae P10297]|uniref:Uncharacterized protein n=1 Tax=Phytophthora nicotianae P10297 TaxID=1317064 RepID=W2YZV6_PHYNI|nr:hypothetical protein F442_12048 [Phytophthora nicotianae P10297]
MSCGKRRRLERLRAPVSMRVCIEVVPVIKKAPLCALAVVALVPLALRGARDDQDGWRGCLRTLGARWSDGQGRMGCQSVPSEVWKCGVPGSRGNALISKRAVAWNAAGEFGINYEAKIYTMDRRGVVQST